MFDFATIQTLTSDDVLILTALSPLVEKAKEAEKQIKAVYTFHIGEERITLDSKQYTSASLTRDGLWLFNTRTSHYEIQCNAENIFEHMKANYMVSNKFAPPLDANGYRTPEGEKSEAFSYFRDFLERTSELYAQANNSDK